MRTHTRIEQEAGHARTWRAEDEDWDDDDFEDDEDDDDDFDDDDLDDDEWKVGDRGVVIGVR